LSARWRGTFRRSRRSYSAVIGLTLAASIAGLTVAPEPVGAYGANGTWTVASPTSASSTAASGLTTTVTTAGGVAVTGHDPLSQTNSPASSEYTPQLPLSVDALRWSVTADGTVTIRFSRPVRNPSVHLEGIGAFAGGATDYTASQSAYTLLSGASDGATLGAVSAGATNLRITGGDTITTTGDFPDTQCNSTSSSGHPEDGTAGCGSVAIDGTVTQLTFAVDYRSKIIAGFGAPGAGADAVGFAVTVDKDYSDAPAGYNAGDAPRHVVGDLSLGRTVDADDRGELDSSTSPFPASGTGVNTGGDNTNGADEDALGAWPALTTAMIGSKYAVTVPVAGASAAGEVCGYVDFAHTGSFSADPGERACAPFAAGAHSVELSWTVPSTMTAGITYARLRAAYDPDEVERPTGPAASGEVEDYAVSILATVTVRNSMPAHTGGAFDLSVNNTVQAGGTGDGGSTGVLTVGPAAGSLARPDIAVGGDLASAAAPLTVSESPARANGFGYASAVTCADASGTVVASANGTAVGVAVPASGGVDSGNAQNITCTFTNTGIATLGVTAAADPATVAAIGPTVNFAFTVTNTGPVPVTSVGLVTRFSTPAGPTPKLNCPASVLDPQQSMTCTAAYTATQADVDQGHVTNTATAMATTGSVEVASAASTVETAIDAPSALAVTLTGNVNGAATVGDVATVTAKVTNTGLTTIKSLTLSTPSGPVSCGQSPLAPAASITCELPTRTVTEVDTNTGQVATTVVASGRAVGGPVRSEQAVFAAAVAAPIPLTGVFDLGPTIGAGGGAVLAGIGLLLLASTTGTRRRGRAT
jgi:hypothetical protein